MGKAIGGALLGTLLGIIVGGVITFNTQNADGVSIVYSRHAFCLVVGAGFGTVAGAIVGSASAIVDAMSKEK